MSDRSVREMSSAERKRHSLESRVYRSVLMGAVIFGFFTLLIGLGLYATALIDQYTGDAYDLAKSAELVLRRVGDPGSLAERVLEIYGGMSEAEREAAGSEEYYERFREIEQSREYAAARSVLNDFRTTADIDDIYFAIYVRDPDRLVYIADPEDKPGVTRRIGDWEAVEQKECDTFLNLKWDRKGRLQDRSVTEAYGWMCTAGVPVSNAEGEVVGFVLSDITLEEVSRGMRSFLIQYVVTTLILVNAVGYLISRHMKKAVVEPVNEIAGAAQDYVRDRRAGAESTDHFAKLRIRTGDEVENLSLVMADMERDLCEYEDSLTRVTAEKERISTELELAGRIQAEYLPNIFPPFPERSDFDIYADMKPAKEIGGDFYDFFLIDEDRLGMVIADVSGKGVPAALFMMISKMLIQTHTLTGGSPKEVLERINAIICQNNREGMFVTVWLGVLDLKTGKLTAANAGHEYPVLKKPGGSFKLVKDKHGFVVGGLEDVQYREYELQLEPGSMLFLYTDGLTEAADESDSLFGTERMLAALNENAAESPQGILQKVHEAVSLFAGEAPQADDLTMLCLQYNGQRDGGANPVKELTVEAKLENLGKVTDFIDENLEQAGCPQKTQFQIDVAVDEIFTNISQYAYLNGVGSAVIRFFLEEDPKTAVITFVDKGLPFNPMEKEDPDVTLSAEERQIGGLGIYMVKKSMDSMSYEYRDGSNILQIRKKL